MTTLNALLTQKHPFITKVIGWLWRYLPAELVGTSSALVSAGLALYVGAEPFGVALAGSVGELLGFYLPLFWRELADQRAHHARFAALWQTLRNLAVEFGVAELVDSLVAGPVLTVIMMQFVSAPLLAVMLSKLVTDTIFYSLAISGFELRQFFFSETH